jgi:hypothetical protein
VGEYHGKQTFLCSAIPEKCAFLAKFSEPSFRMTNEKFSMTYFQFRLNALVAACRAAALRPGVFALSSYRSIDGERHLTQRRQDSRAQRKSISILS